MGRLCGDDTTAAPRLRLPAAADDDGDDGVRDSPKGALLLLLLVGLLGDLTPPRVGAGKAPATLSAVAFAADDLDAAAAGRAGCWELALHTAGLSAVVLRVCTLWWSMPCT